MDFSSSAWEAPSLSVTCEGEISWECKAGGWWRRGMGDGGAGGYVVERHGDRKVAGGWMAWWY